YFYTFTKVSDAYSMARLMSVSWYSPSVLAVTNFLVFLTDSAVLQVIKEVRLAIASRFRAKRKSGSSDDLSDSQLKAGKRPGVTIKESKPKTSSGDEYSIDSADLEIPHAGATDPTYTSSALEHGRYHAAALFGLEEDAITRRVRGGADAQSLLGDM
ncbi:hypothetical protein IWQ57_006097, partial [Coemansia nantahalensis]